MYIERGIYDWRQTTALITMIYMATPAKKDRIDPESINPYIQMKNQTAHRRKTVSLAAVASQVPGVRIINKRIKANPKESKPCR